MKIIEKSSTLLSGLTSARSSILQYVETIPPDREDEVFLGIWSIKDLLAHLEGWDHTNLQAIQEILAGKPPTFFQFADRDWQRYNQTLVQRYRRDSLDEQLANQDRSHQQLMLFLESLPAQELVNGKVKRDNGRTITIRNLILSETRDELQHAEQIRGYFGMGKNGGGDDGHQAK
jgi:hypothetical protein